MSWKRATLSVAERDKWEVLLRHVAVGAIRRVRAEARRRVNGSGIERLNLARGSAGIALFYAYHHLITGQSSSKKGSLEVLDLTLRALTRIQCGRNVYEGFSLYEGILGIGWVTEHIRKCFPEAIPADACSGINSLLEETLYRVSRPMLFDLVAGLSGIAVYLLECERTPATERLLANVIERLCDQSCRKEGTVHWFTPAELVVAARGLPVQDGVLDLGVAHGNAGVISLLSRVVISERQSSRSILALAGAARWLRDKRLPASSGGGYVSFLEGSSAPAHRRYAWCYGDPGVSTALLAASTALGDADLASFALSGIKSAAKMTYARTGVVDAGLCHGAAGLAHMFGRVANTTGDDELREAALLWLRRTLQFRLPGVNHADAKNLRPWRRRTGLRWKHPFGFLEGACGIGLVGMASLSDISPSWDRILLLS